MSEYQSILHELADKLLEYFEGEDAVNYIEQIFTCNDDTSKSFALTMQKVEGLTPCQKLEKAEKKISELEIMCDNAHEALVAARDSGAIRESDVMKIIEKGLDNLPQDT